MTEQYYVFSYEEIVQCIRYEDIIFAISQGYDETIPVGIPFNVLGVFL